MALISVITPCFNDGIYLDDAFNSIQLDKYSDEFECIIINDGSTDEFTLRKLNELQVKGAIVIHQENRGLAEARNAAIKIAKGKYILPLDSDNKIIPEVFLQAAAIMESNENIDVVYTDARYFGDRNEDWLVGPFEGEKLLQGNFIDACALVRTTTIINSGIYDSQMPSMGNEDWELWLRFFLLKKLFFYLRQIGFYYRVRNNSMSVFITRPASTQNKAYIYWKHCENISRLLHFALSEKKRLGDQLKLTKETVTKNRIKTTIKVLLGKNII